MWSLLECVCWARNGCSGGKNTLALMCSLKGKKKPTFWVDEGWGPGRGLSAVEPWLVLRLLISKEEMMMTGRGP